YFNVAADQFLEVIEGQGLITGRSSLSDDKFRAYPNPFNDILTLEGTTIGQVQLLDMAGKTQSVEILSDRKRAVINGSSLPVGNYLVKVMSENGDEVIHKVVKAQR
ncbi:MAG: T9SS type A sorting domain-containing protein, partial [Bacteroidetes bacterium]